MSSLLNIYFKKEQLQTMLNAADKGLSITISVNDETNKFGQNCSAFITQTKEQREAKANKVFVGNGSVNWTDGKITKAEKVEQKSEPREYNPDNPDDLPF